MKKLIIPIIATILIGCTGEEQTDYSPTQQTQSIKIGSQIYSIQLSNLWQKIEADKQAGEIFAYQNNHQNLILKRYKGTPKEFQTQLFQKLKTSQFLFQPQQNTEKFTQFVTKPTASSPNRIFYQKFLPQNNQEFLLLSCSHEADLPTTDDCNQVLKNFGAQK